MDRALWAGAGVSLRDGEGVVEYALHPGGYIRFGDEFVLVAHPRAPHRRACNGGATMSAFESSAENRAAAKGSAAQGRANGV